MKKEDFTYLAAKHANQTATESEAQQVEAYYDAMQEKHKQMHVAFSHAKKKKILNTIKQATNRKNYFTLSKSSLAIAAAFLILFGLTVAVSILETAKIKHVATNKGERKEIILPDGSTIFLNANSQITYNTNFSNNRHVTLQGEAFFKVTKNPENPFTILSQDIETTVLGTSFNINSNTPNKTTISVNTGKVQIKHTKKSKNPTFYLTKNQQLSFLNGLPLKVLHNNSDDLMAWTKNIIVLNNEPLKHTIVTLENWYNVKIDLLEKELESETISGKFKNEKLENVLKSIALLKNLDIQIITPKHIAIRKNTP